MGRRNRIAAVVLAALMMGGCYGPFTLVRKVYNWNGQVSDNKWIVELVYLVCTWLPVYGIAGAADAIIFNSVVFWTGKSLLIDDAAAPATQKIVRGDQETVLTKVSADELLIEQYTKGQPEASVRLRRDGNDMVAVNAEGTTLFRAETQPDGGIVIADASGQTVATHSAADVNQLAESVQQ